MPQTGTQLRAKLTDRTNIPAMTVGTNLPGAPGLVVNFDLVFQGVQFKPEDVFDALETKFGSGKVLADTDAAGRLGPHRWRVIA